MSSAMPNTPRRLRVIGGISCGLLSASSTPSRLEARAPAITGVTPTRVRVEFAVEALINAPIRTVTVVDSDSDDDAAAVHDSVVDVSSDSDDGGDHIDRLDGLASNAEDDIPDNADVPDYPPPDYDPPVYTPTGIPMKKCYRPTPPSELRRFEGPCFLLVRAEETGLYEDDTDMRLRIAGLGRRAIWEWRRTYADGYRLYNEAYDNGHAQAEPLAGGPFTDNVYDWVPDVPAQIVHRDREDGYYPAPEHLRRQIGMYKFYVVTKGEEVGIFGSWYEAAVRVDSLRALHRAEWKCCTTWREALQIYRRAFYTDGLSATPVVGGPFDIHFRESAN